jgi:hypothetical protein
MVSGMGQDTTSKVRGGVQDADEYIDQHHTGRERDPGSGSRVSVYQAADLLGVTVDAIRKRIQRGTIPHERHEDGRVYVLLDEARALQDKSSKPTSTVQDEVQDDSQVPYLTGELVTELRTQNEWLRREVERKDAILLRMAERLPELEAVAEPREAPVSTSEEADKGKVPAEQQEPSHRRSWLRAFFGLPQ